MSQATAQRNGQSHSFTATELYQIVPERLQSRVDSAVFKTQSQFTHDGRQVGALAILAGCKTHLSPKPDENGEMFTSISKDKAVSSAASYLASNYNSWFTPEFTAEDLEDAFWHGDTGEPDALGDYQLVESTEYVNLASDPDVERVVVPLVGLLLTRVQQMDDTDSATPDRREQQAVAAQRDIKQAVLAGMRDAGLSHNQVIEAFKAAENDIQRLEDGIDTQM